jgi:hypothetical protein
VLAAVPAPALVVPATAFANVVPIFVASDLILRPLFWQMLLQELLVQVQVLLQALKLDLLWVIA